MAVVALLVIGPEKLPKVARTLGAFAGRLQRYVAEVKDEINREARFEDLKNIQKDIRAGAKEVESSIMAGVNEITNAPEVKAAKPKNPTSAKKLAAKKFPVKKATTKKPRIRKTATKKAVVKAIK